MLGLTARGWEFSANEVGGWGPAEGHARSKFACLAFRLLDSRRTTNGMAHAPGRVRLAFPIARYRRPGRAVFSFSLGPGWAGSGTVTGDVNVGGNRTEVKGVTTWGRGFLARLACFWIPSPTNRRESIENPNSTNDDKGLDTSRSGGGTGHVYFPPIRAGGGPSKRLLEREKLAQTNAKSHTPVSLGEWPHWGPSEQQGLIERLMGCSVSAATKGNYEGHFRLWSMYRGACGLDPYVGRAGLSEEQEEDNIMGYVALSVGPLSKAMSTVATHLSGIGYCLRLRSGENPLLSMPRLQLMLKGMYRERGATVRKLPFMLDDLRSLKEVLELGIIDQQIVWCAALLGWFFMLHMSEFLYTKNKNMSADRHPLYMRDIEPRCVGQATHWGPHVDEVSVHIAGSKTDWLNAGCIRSHTRVPLTEPNSDLCVVRALCKLYEAYPQKFRTSREKPFATWKSGGHVTSGHLTALLRAAVYRRGSNPGAYSLHSLRAGGATALYQATKDVELVARFGRWKTKSISAYLWESHQMLAGLSDRMLAVSHTLHFATKGKQIPTYVGTT